MNEIWKVTKVIFTHPIVQTVVILATVLLALTNAYIAARISPFAVSLQNLTQVVTAQGKQIQSDEQYIPQFIKVQTQVGAQTDQLNRIEQRVDSIDNFLRGYK